MKYKALLLILFVICTPSFSQKIKDKNVLFTIENEPVTLEDFNRMYQKNINLVQQEEQKDKNNYLNLFVNYKLKVKEAYNQGLDKDSVFVKEYAGYRNQLAQKYLYEHKITEELIRETYDRMQEQIKAGHILVLVSQDAIPADTLSAYNKIADIRKKALAGEDFETLAKQYSEDPSAAENAGNLGYFSAFQMVYPFESAAYNTPVGHISDIVRTRFGYHIIKVYDRRELPEEITAAHIMIAHRQQSEVENTKRQIDDIYQRLLQGENFETLVKQYSQDVPTVERGGIIGRFGAGRLNAPDFEEAAFALKNPGDFSKPVMTDFGWHIIKLIERHPKSSFNEVKNELLERIKGTDRTQKVEQSEIERIKSTYGFKSDPEILNYFNNIVTDSIYLRRWKFDTDDSNMQKTAFTIGNKTYSYKDFAAHVVEMQKKIRNHDKSIPELLIGYYRGFEREKLKDFFKNTLEAENTEYANLLQEYREGLLIYELMQKNIWKKAKNDSLGLVAYFQKNQNQYVWNTRVNALIGSTIDENVADRVKLMLMNNQTKEAILDSLNTDKNVVISFTEGIYELDHPALPEGFQAKTGIAVYPSATMTSNHFVIIKVTEVLPAGHKTFEEVKGRVTGDYQNALEQQWMQELRQKYSVIYNQKAIKRL